MFKRLVFIMIIASIISMAQAKDKHYRIDKEIFNSRIKRVAIAPTENIVWERMQYLRNNDADFNILTSNDPLLGIINIKANEQLLHNKKYIDSINLMTDEILYRILDKKGRFSIVKSDSTRQILNKLRNETITPNILNTQRGNLSKTDLIKGCAVEANVDAVLIPSFSFIARDDSYMYTFQAIMIDSNGVDTLWTGDGILRRAIERFYLERLFNDSYIENAVKDAIGSISKKKN
jgi:hypothetical protein